MIVTKLRGGLGNQMFQYASAKALALHHNTELKLDIRAYNSDPDKRTFELFRFCIDEEVISIDELRSFAADANSFFFEQPHYHYCDGFFKLPSHCYLSGYWQSEKYFVRNRQQILSSFEMKNELDIVNRSMIDRLNNENSVSIHVRRGDYVWGKHNDFFKALDVSYYKTAIRTMQALYENVKFYVFSDDLAWCRDAFRDYDHVSFVGHNANNDSYADIILMSACRHNIIANSTFSWWAAWLNRTLGKIVIAPKQWFGKTYRDIARPVYKERAYNTRDLIPEGWLMV